MLEITPGNKAKGNKSFVGKSKEGFSSVGSFWAREKRPGIQSEMTAEVFTAVRKGTCLRQEVKSPLEEKRKNKLALTLAWLLCTHPESSKQWSQLPRRANPGTH